MPSPARESAFGIAEIGPRPVSRGLHAGRRPRHDLAERGEAVRLGVVAAHDHHRRGRVVQARRVAGRDREVLDLGVQRLERRHLLHRAAAARVLVGVEDLGRAVAHRDLDRDDLLFEATLVDRGDRALVRTERPRVAVGAGEAGGLRGVVTDGDRHVEGGRVGSGGVRRRHPLLVVVGAERALHGGAARWRSTPQPPAITTLSMPAMMLAAAPWTDAMPDAQWRLSATPGISESPSSTAA